ncbi:DUF4835 family protein [Psychroflexus gondwanensis]|jgi:hypothetical protein|uniref:DUF4835 domain-containing protein n=1 Tax=Psychroflexus gondwanensis ACAM 44 TaxID=1189619 RepID=N1WNH6_9FLAO|nr:DUF4835 family protein [Psychroflexus gondwanensis]EMY81846.1 hypothetical protein pgond44_04865 [Psychroflexus gondwanensis ACAM 44]TXE19841.1 DUF4835 family protein [Psychroflexus gondwanensis]
MTLKLIFLLLLFPFAISAQVLEAEVVLDAQQTGRNQLTIFRTLEKDLNEFINNTSWTDNTYDSHERIKCSFNIIIQAYDSDNFQATLQVQSSRPVFASSMNSIVLNISDSDFNFNYKEFEPLNYNPNVFTNNLVSTISFYVYTILGYDADTFVEQGGDEFYEEARKIVNAASQRGGNGWKESGATQSRFGINRDLLSRNFSNYRKALYVYHREGLDVMHEDIEKGKENIVTAINLISENSKTRPNAPLFRIFFDAKSDEIMQILSGGPEMDISSTLSTLNQVAPVHNRKWRTIEK